MLIGQLFETRIEDTIEPVIKVGDNADESKLADEIGAYVVTPTIENYLATFFEHYTDTFQTGTGEIGVWISGYFGSGKSHLAKIMALVAGNRRLQGQTACQRFEGRLRDDMPRAGEIRRALARIPQCDTQVLAFNLNTLADSKTTPLAKLLLSEYYQSKGYSANVLYARVIESELDAQGKLEAVHHAAETSSKKSWADIRTNPSFYQSHLYRAACELAPETFPNAQAVADALQKAQAGEIHNVGVFLDTILRDLEQRQKATHRAQRLMLVLDESGQWIESDAGRLAQLQALIEEAAVKGRGKIWVTVTTHADMGSIYKEARALDGDMKKIEGRFRYKFALTTENIELVLEDRLFKKTVSGRNELTALYGQRGGTIRDVGQLEHCEQTLPPCTEEKFAIYYPFLPYQVHLIPEIVKSLRSRGGLGEALSGSTRVLLAITQDVLRYGRRTYVREGVGPLVSFDEIYHDLARGNEISPDVRDELGRLLKVVPGATKLTLHVAEVLYLIRELPYVHRSKGNIARLLVESVDDDVAALVNRVEPELERLKKAKMVSQSGEEYEFLTGEKRTFEEAVATREAEIQVKEREHGLAEHFFHNAAKTLWNQWFDIQTVPYAEREFEFKLFLDGFAVPGRKGDVTIRLATPLSNDTVPSLQDRSHRPDEQNTIFVHTPRIAGFDANLGRFLAMRETIDVWKGDTHRSEDARLLAQEREGKDLPKLKVKVLEGLKDALSRAVIVFRAASRNVAGPAGKRPIDVLKRELSTYWPVLYPKFDRMPVKVVNEEAAIREVLSGGTGNRDVAALKLFDKAGKLDPSSVLVDAIRVYLAGQQDKKARVLGSDLLKEFSAPPYGWDANAVRVGVAALVRAAAVRVLVGKKPFTNPADTDLVDALRVSRNFDKVELILEESEVDFDVLAAVRTVLRTLAKVRNIDETPAALSEVAGQVSADLLAKVGTVRLWASGASFPLPPSFESAAEVWGKLPTLTNPVLRVNEVHRDQGDLQAGKVAIELHVSFQSDHGTQFVGMCALAAEASGIAHNLATGSIVEGFLSAFNATKLSGAFAEKETWKALRANESSARLEIAALGEQWRTEARRIATTALTELTTRVVDLGLAADAGTALAAPISDFLAGLDSVVASAPASGLVDKAHRLGRELDAALAAAAAARTPTVKPVVVYDKPPGDSPRPAPPRERTIRKLHVADVTIGTVIRDEATWDTMSKKLDERVRKLLADGFDVEIG
jgi:hypothetical protein